MKPLRLLGSVPVKIHDRLIVRYQHETDGDFATSYHFAAKRLSETFCGEPIDDLILLPFLTLYRHAFELQLKDTVRFLATTRIDYVDGPTSDLVDAISEERLKREFGHNLHKLLNEVRSHYDALNLPEAFPKDVEDLVLMLHEADKSGTAFRYSGLLPSVQEHADFPDLAALLDEQFTKLTVIEDYVDGIYSSAPTLRELVE